MFIYFGRTHSAWSTNSVLKRVICDQCSTEYYYQMTRTGQGRGESPFMLDEKQAAARAQYAADRQLQLRLESDTELVPCPRCHWVNDELIRGFRRQRWTRLVSYASVPLVIVGIFLLLIVPGLRPTSLLLIGAALLALCLFSPLWLRLVRHLLRLRIDPNRSHPHPPVVPPATPVPLLWRPDPLTGEMTLQPVFYLPEQLWQKPGWAVLRPDRMHFPASCCVCMRNATTVYQSPFTVDKNSELRVPICQPCRAAARRRWWLAFLPTAAAALGISALPALIIPGLDAFGRWMLFILIGLFATGLALAIVPGRITGPYRYRIIDYGRGVAMFKAAPAFIQLLEEAARDQAANPEPCDTAVGNA